MSAPIRLKVRPILSAVHQMGCRMLYTIESELGQISGSASVAESPSRRLNDLSCFIHNTLVFSVEAVVLVSTRLSNP